MLLSTSITDEVVTLRPFRPEDAQEILIAVCESLEELKPWMSWAHEGYSMQEVNDFIAITRPRWEEIILFAFAITDANTGGVIGGCSLSDLHPVYHLCNVGYWVRSLRHGEGIAGRAARLAARFGFEQAGLIRAEIVVMVGNEKSIRVAKKIGAHYEGILLNRMVMGKSIYDAHMYSLIPSDLLFIKFTELILHYLYPHPGDLVSYKNNLHPLKSNPC
jgi:RimJ/RimL family protein N-acetyltransferase